jgi:hypothetical protein
LLPVGQDHAANAALGRGLKCHINWRQQWLWGFTNFSRTARVDVVILSFSA